MHAGQRIVDGTESFLVTRSAADGDGCAMEVTLAPGAVGPPLHTHDEPESFEVLAGSIVFSLDGVDRTFHAGQSWVIPPGCVHSFRNASKTEPVRASGVHGGRFERLVDQLAAGGPKFLRLSLYLRSVDPRASYMVSPAARALLWASALLARLVGVRVAPATGRYGIG